jgi:hypothetical protein
VREGLQLVLADRGLDEALQALLIVGRARRLERRMRPDEKEKQERPIGEDHCRRGESEK